MSKVLNHRLGDARSAKQDEFYTRLIDIERELKHYKKHFKSKTVYCNADDPRQSRFVHYFSRNSADLGIQRLITSHGDFRSAECIELLKQADIVVTNPPFSLFREYVMQLIEHDRKFLILGNKNAVTYSEIFPLFQENKMWIGHTPMGTEMLFDVTEEFGRELVGSGRPRKYTVIDGAVMGRAQACWFTNLDFPLRRKDLVLHRTYNPKDYPTYDNFDAIEVGSVVDIPMDYDGLMGVPITFLDKHNPDQFEIIGSFNAGGHGLELGAVKTETESKGKTIMWNGPVVNKKPLYKRIVIRRKASDD